MLELQEDIGWDTELTPGGTSRGFKGIKKVLLDYGLVAYSHGNTYVFLSASNSWSVFVSAESQVQLCSITNNESASVNYLSACLPYIGYLEKHARRSGSIPTSINVGTWRMSVLTDENEGRIILRKSENIVAIDSELDSRISSFCVMPCTFNEIPLEWKPGGPERLLKYTLVLFPDERSLHTIMWIIGNAVVDPGTASKFLLLYGPGGTGKSTIIKLIETVLKGCCSTIKPGVLTDSRDDITTDTAKSIASNRVLTAGEINLETAKLNLHNVKVMTGHDTISVPPLKVTTRCSVVAGCNNLPHPTIQHSWISNAISRRVVVVLMNVDTTLIPKRQMPDSPEDLLDFLMHCVYIRLTHNSIPSTTVDVLYSLLGDLYNDISSKIEISNDVSEQDIFDANTGIEIYLGIRLHLLGELAFLRSPECVVLISSIYFIKDIRLKEPLNC